MKNLRLDSPHTEVQYLSYFGLLKFLDCKQNKAGPHAIGQRGNGLLKLESEIILSLVRWVFASECHVGFAFVFLPELGGQFNLLQPAAFHHFVVPLGVIADVLVAHDRIGVVALLVPHASRPGAVAATADAAARRTLRGRLVALARRR